MIHNVVFDFCLMFEDVGFHDGMVHRELTFMLHHAPMT